MPENHVFTAHIQPRYRDLNPGHHVDSVECIRLIDEGRQLFLRFADLPGTGAGKGGLYAARPDGIVDLLAAQRAEYRSEVLFTSYEPFEVRLWISRIGGTSLEISGELRVTPDAEPSVVGVCTMVQIDPTTGAPWQLDERFRAALGSYAGDRVAMRD